MDINMEVNMNPIKFKVVKVRFNFVKLEDIHNLLKSWVRLFKDITIPVVKNNKDLFIPSVIISNIPNHRYPNDTIINTKDIWQDVLYTFGENLWFYDLWSEPLVLYAITLLLSNATLLVTPIIIKVIIHNNITNFPNDIFIFNIINHINPDVTNV